MEIEIESSPLFLKNYDPPTKIMVNRGGTRSGKTVGIVQCALFWLMFSNESGYWSIVRKTLPSLMASAYRDFLFLFQKLPQELQDSVHWSKDKSNITFTFLGRTVEFHSLDDIQKIRSRKRRHLHIVESNEVDFETFTQLIIRTTGNVYLDFNPDDIDSWINQEIEITRASVKKDVTVIVSTYLDNPFLSKNEIEEIEYLKAVDPELWAVFGEGKYGKVTGIIFKNYKLIDEFPLDYGYHIGLDWGFTKDPSAAVRVAVHNNRLYLDEVLYERGLINSQIGKALAAFNKTVVPDSAEPKSIEDLRRQGLSVIPSVKGPDSVRAGLDRMSEFELHVTKRSINLIKELNHYKRDLNGDPIDAYNHAIDAARYVVQTVYKRSLGPTQYMTVNNFKRAVA